MKLDNMPRKVKIDRARLDRFKFREIKDIKTKLKTNPELSVKLKEDFIGTIKAQGVSLDDNTLEAIRVEVAHPDPE